MLSAPRGSYRLAIAPAVLAVRDLAGGESRLHGLVPADRMVGAEDLLAFVRRLGITVERG